MSQLSIRRVIPPRDLAATITARSVIRAGWAVALVYLCIAVIALLNVWVSRGYGPTIAVSFISLAATIAALSAVIRRPTPARGAVYLAVGTVAGFIYDYGLLAADPDMNDTGMYLLTRVTAAMLLIGAIGKGLLHGVLWCSAGCFLGMGATISAQLSLGIAPNPGIGPLMLLTIYIVIMLMFALIRRNQRRFTLDFSAVEAETGRMAGQRELEERAVALVHDTVLNDLAALISGRDELDDRMRDRIRRDIDAVTNAQSDPEPERPTAGGDLRDELLALMREFQWRGLTVDVSGGEALAVDVAPNVAYALVGAVSGSLENVLLHSGTDSAEVFVDVIEDSLSVMIVDQGGGFDPTTVSENRLGIRSVVVKQIESCGGSVRIWSAPGSGTSVILNVPFEARDE